MSKRARLSKSMAIFLALAVFFAILFIFFHRNILLTGKTQALSTVTDYLEGKYEKEIVVQKIDYNFDIFPQNDCFNMICSDGATEFAATMWVNNVRITDSYGVTALDQRIQGAVKFCAERIGIASNLKSITWRLEGPYQSDSDQSLFFDIDPEAPLSSITRIQDIEFDSIYDLESCLDSAKQLLGALFQEYSVSLDYVEFSFIMDEHCYVLGTSTEKIKTAAIEDFYMLF